MGVFGDINEVRLIGNITNEIELKHTPNGFSVTNFGLATNRNYKVGEEWKEEVTFHDIVIWGNDAEMLSQRAKKGTRVYIQGRLMKRKWEDKEGAQRTKVEIVADKIILLDRYEKGVDTRSQESTKTSGKSSKGSDDVSEDSIDPNDLPF